MGELTLKITQVHKIRPFSYKQGQRTYRWDGSPAHHMSQWTCGCLRTKQLTNSAFAACLINFGHTHGILKLFYTGRISRRHLTLESICYHKHIINRQHVPEHLLIAKIRMIMVAEILFVHRCASILMFLFILWWIVLLEALSCLIIYPPLTQSSSQRLVSLHFVEF